MRTGVEKKLENNERSSQFFCPKTKIIPQAHFELLKQDKAQIKGAHLHEASETLAKTIFINGAKGALKSVLE